MTVILLLSRLTIRGSSSRLALVHVGWCQGSWFLVCRHPLASLCTECCWWLCLYLLSLLQPQHWPPRSPAVHRLFSQQWTSLEIFLISLSLLLVWITVIQWFGDWVRRFHWLMLWVGVWVSVWWWWICKYWAGLVQPVSRHHTTVSSCHWSTHWSDLAPLTMHRGNIGMKGWCCSSTVHSAFTVYITTIICSWLQQCIKIICTCTGLKIYQIIFLMENTDKTWKFFLSTYFQCTKKLLSSQWILL